MKPSYLAFLLVAGIVVYLLAISPNANGTV